MGNEVKKRAWRGSREISWEAITVARDAKTVAEARASAKKRLDRDEVLKRPTHMELISGSES